MFSGVASKPSSQTMAMSTNDDSCGAMRIIIALFYDHVLSKKRRRERTSRIYETESLEICTSVCGKV
jgi:hypothetical protein